MWWMLGERPNACKQVVSDIKVRFKSNGACFGCSLVGYTRYAFRQVSYIPYITSNKQTNNTQHKMEKVNRRHRQQKNLSSERLQIVTSNIYAQVLILAFLSKLYFLMYLLTCVNFTRGNWDALDSIGKRRWVYSLNNCCKVAKILRRRKRWSRSRNK